MGRGKYRKRAETAPGRPEAVPAATVSPERLAARQRRRRKVLLTWSIIAAALVMAVLIVWSLLPKPSPYVAFAKCLTAQGAVMYGTDWCTHCQAQKRLFGDAFADVAFENCDYAAACQEHNITGYPTWIMPDGERLEGTQPLQLLADKTGCVLPG